MAKLIKPTHCRKCNTKLSQHKVHGTLFCAPCNKWVDKKKCIDPKCTFCTNRPEKPKQIFTWTQYSKKKPPREKLLLVRKISLGDEFYELDYFVNRGRMKRFSKPGAPTHWMLVEEPSL